MCLKIGIAEAEKAKMSELPGYMEVISFRRNTVINVFMNQLINVLINKLMNVLLINYDIF